MAATHKLIFPKEKNKYILFNIGNLFFSFGVRIVPVEFVVLGIFYYHVEHYFFYDGLGTLCLVCFVFDENFGSKEVA